MDDVKTVRKSGRRKSSHNPLPATKIVEEEMQASALTSTRKSGRLYPHPAKNLLQKRSIVHPSIVDDGDGDGKESITKKTKSMIDLP